MNSLIIDTSTNLEYIAISKNNSYYGKSAYVERSHSAALFENLNLLLDKAGMSIKEINLIACAVGPGSFTGIRIAVSTARMFSQLLKAPMIGIKTHDLYASSTKGEKGDNIIVAFDAKKGRVFGALYKITEDPITPEILLEPGDYEIGYILKLLDNSCRTLLIGDGITKYEEIVKENVLQPVILNGFSPDLDLSIKKIQTLHSSGSSTTDFTKITPFYARKSDAEILRNIKLKK